MNLKSILSLLMLTVALTMSAQIGAPNSTADTDTTKTDTKSPVVYTDVKDHITHEAIKGVKAELVWAADSTHADTVHVEYHDEEYYKSSFMYFPIKQAGKYLVKVEADGYVTKYVPFEVKKIYKRERYMTMKTIYLHTVPKKNEIELDEIVVVATKLKFYMNGDTLVYDADAFNLAEGSMLNTLIKQLPGVELEKGGVIKVNGRQVDALLLNGKNFFDSDRELMLENMPAYMVKNIQSYERVPESVKGSPREKVTKKELVMNVKLKREYATGWIANAEGGVGTTFFRNQNDKLDTKWMGRLFGLRFTDNSRLNVYANVNNLNDTGGAGYEGEWGQLSQSGGLTTSYNVGGNYMRDKEDSYRFMASVNGSYVDTDNSSNTSNATFLEGGDTYGRSFQSSRNYSWNLNTNQDITLDGSRGLGETFKHYFLTFRPSFNYRKWDNRGDNGSVTLMEDVASQLGKAWMDSIMAPNAGELLKKYAINRTLTSSKGKGHQANGGIEGFFSFTPAHNDYIDLNLTYGYQFSDQKSESFEHYTLDYPNSTTLPTDFRNRYTPNKDRSQQANAGANMGIALDQEQHHRLNMRYNFSYNYNDNNQSLYLLNKLKEWDTASSSATGVFHPLGTLPSMEEMLTTLDAENSSHSKTKTTIHQTNIDYTLTPKTSEEKFVQLTFSFHIPFIREKMDYLRGTQVDTLMTRNTAFINPGIYFSHEKYRKNRGFNVSYNLNTNAPGMTSLLNIRDDSNPLYITLGNPNLKNTRTHNANISGHAKYGKIFVNAAVMGGITENAVASGFIYNKETGVRTVMPENVNGNWNMNTHIGINIALDKDDKWRLGQRVSYGHNNSVDLSGTNLSDRATKSVVKNDNVNDYVSLTWRPSSKYSFGTTGNLSYQHSASDREGFNAMNVYTFNYGANATLELPLDFQVSSDITMYSRRGYSEPSMNTNELVWNARLSKRLMKGKLTIMFDGFDLLGNLSNVQRTVNAQGRTETFNNVIPSYGILHAIYRINVPKKVKGRSEELAL
ncbi:MAG: outer membrane beta-barrel protein [Bacteroidaceae bacterium]|nr:outer membrane beta-barrel protein [Bacteroidaceae bacterium]